MKSEYLKTRVFGFCFFLPCCSHLRNRFVGSLILSKNNNHMGTPLILNSFLPFARHHLFSFVTEPWLTPKISNQVVFERGKGCGGKWWLSSSKESLAFRDNAGMGLRAREAKLCEAEGLWQDLVRSMQGGWSKEHFEPCRALACLLMDLPRARPAAFVQRISWIIPWALERCFFFKKQFFKKEKFGSGCRGNAPGQVGWGSMCVGEGRWLHIHWLDGQTPRARTVWLLVSTLVNEGASKGLF